MVVFYHSRIYKICRSSTYHRDLIKENIITKLQKLYSPPRNLRACNKLPVLFLKKCLCTGDLSPARKILIKRPGQPENLDALVIFGLWCWTVCHLFLRANKITFKTWNFYFAKMSTGIVKKQQVLTPLNFFFKFSHCWFLIFSLFLVHVNWTVHYVAVHLFKLFYQYMRQSI